MLNNASTGQAGAKPGMPIAVRVISTICLLHQQSPSQTALHELHGLPSICRPAGLSSPACLYGLVFAQQVVGPHVSCNDLHSLPELS